MSTAKDYIPDVCSNSSSGIASKTLVQVTNYYRDSVVGAPEAIRESGALKNAKYSPCRYGHNPRRGQETPPRFGRSGLCPY